MCSLNCDQVCMGLLRPMQSVAWRSNSNQPRDKRFVSSPPRTGRPWTDLHARMRESLPGSPSLVTSKLNRYRMYCPEFSYRLGSSRSTNSCSTVVHMESFSTSVCRVYISIFATTTKICTGGSSIRACSLDFLAHRCHRLARRGIDR